MLLKSQLESLALAVALGLVGLFAPEASAQQLRFSTTAPGRLIGTGNALGLSKQLNANGPGTHDSIGTFISLGNGLDNNPANPANPWPAGTTSDCTQNGSTALLQLPNEPKILYAELLYGGSTFYRTDDVRS